MDKSLLNPIGPLGSIVIGLVMIGLSIAGIYPGGLNLSWLGLAFLLGGTIMLMVRIMIKKKTELPK
ncbi:MAG: hypothetical protein KTR15_08800 [Phycisphaeraceae bacterium]|nr:hypothetical protein [Phycisphaeraceae bacterium]